MSWTKSERDQINHLSKCIQEIKVALVGDLQKDRPGLQDRVRDLEKRHKYLFLLSGITLFGFVWLAANGGVESLIKFVIGVLS